MAKQIELDMQHMTINGKQLIYQKRPLTAGQLKAGDAVTFELDTGKVTKIERADGDDHTDR